MKKEKSLVVPAITVLTFVLISGCLLPGENDSPEEISLSGLDQLRSVQVGLESSFSLVSGNPATDSVSKGLNPAGNGRVSNYLQAGHEMYFTLQPISGSIYHVKMFVYPLKDLWRTTPITNTTWIPTRSCPIIPGRS